MKTLRYLLSMIMVLSVLSLSAQMPRYGKPYKPVHKQARYSAASIEVQAPTATIGSTGSEMMSSGSSLPQAAVTGTTTTYDRHNAPGGPRRVGEDDGFEDEDDPDNPGNPFPLGDAAWPLAMCALAYLIIRVARRRALND